MIAEKNILIISQSYLHKDPRVLQQYEALKGGYNITTLGLSAINPIVKHFSIKHSSKSKKQRMLGLVPLLFNLHGRYESNELRSFSIDFASIGNNFDVIVCNDISALPIGQIISNCKIPIWADLHEYSPRQYENFWWWNITLKSYARWQTKKYLPQCKAITTVCQGLANEYAHNFDITIDGLIYNAPAFEEIEPSKVDNIIRLVHHGGGQQHRKLENMIEMMTVLGPGYSLDFFLMANSAGMKSYINNLKELAQKLEVNVRFNDPVSTKLIAQTINKFDIGVFILEPVNFNYLNALPNKFFEFIQARLAIAVSPNPEMKALVENYELGVVARDYSPAALANEIRKIENIQLVRFKQNSNKLAKKLSAVKSIELINKIVANLTSS